MPAGDDELKLARTRHAEDGDALVAEALGVVSQLLVEAGNPVALDQSLKDLADEPLLCGCVELAVDARPGDLPIGSHPRPQQAAFLVHVVPGETNLLSLLP